MALFSNDDVLGWFCTSNPLPRVPENMPVVTGPGVGRSAAIEKLKAEAIAVEAAKERQRQANRPQPLKRSPAKAKDSYYDRVRRLEEISKIYNEDETDITSTTGTEDIGPTSRPFNSSAFPGDDDYDPRQNTETDVYKSCSFDVNLTPPLPIANHRQEIVRVIESNSVTVIQGETGSGKSTQVAQYILDHHVRSQKYCNIVCTQPRRIAATSIAKYVSQCRGWDVGGMVGYQIGMDRNISENTRLTFVTTGVLLQKMINMKSLNQYTHIILDEVHERDKDTDFCLLVVRKLIRTNSKLVKVILMSATIEAQMFANYFSSRVEGIPRPAPKLSVEGRTHPVLEFFLDDIRHVGTCKPMDPDNPRVTEEAMNMALRLILSFDDLASDDPRYGKGNFVRGTVLVFLPGLPEIREMQDLLSKRSGTNNWTMLPLHSTISSENQHRVFLKPEAGSRKIILATNIAESSITVPDIRYVIDFCLVKQLTCDWRTKYVCLKTVLASQASLTQRKGRAGRVARGRCYRLIKRDFYNKHVPEYSTPEMLRCPLESVILKAKKLDFGEPRSILGSALQPPKLDDIERAILNLKEVGALTVLYEGVNNPYNGDLTFVGVILETLPIDVRLGRLVILGHVFGCLEDCIIIAAALSARPLLSSSFTNPLKSYKSKRAWANGTDSDCLAFLNAYNAWREQRHLFRGSNEERWCERNMISYRAIREVDEVVRELRMRLATRGIRPPKRTTIRKFEEDRHHRLILKLVICGSFYPQYFSWLPLEEESCEKAMSGHDPKTTIMLSALPRDPVTHSDQICQMFNICGKGKALHFETFKVFVEFERPHSHSRSQSADAPVLDAVLIALKRRQERNKLALYIDETPLPSSQRNEDVPVIRAGALKEMKLPDSGTKQIVITEYIDAGHFWAQLADQVATTNMRRLLDSINTRSLKPLLCPPAKMEGMFCLAPFSEDGLFYRAKVVGMEVVEETNEVYAHVVFVDYGNVEMVNTGVLCELSSSDTELDMQAIECFLTSVKPTIQSSSDGKWSAEANDRFKQLTMSKYLMIQVYSHVGNSLRVDLYDTTSQEDIFINEVLVKEGHAVHCEEPYPSKFAHVQTLAAQASEASTSVGGRGGRYESSTTKTIPWLEEDRTKKYPRGRKFELRGPDSMYEVTFHQMTIAGGYRQARIERDSVNCIVVNSEPQDRRDRLMVAGYVALNPSGNTCIARHTTLMPNIPALLHLVAILFAPCVEMRADELKRQYTGAICGLGFDVDTDESIYSEHDMELTFDTLISQDDLKMVNNLRLVINLAVGDEDVIGELNDTMLQEVQTKARNLIKELILKPRDSITPYQGVSAGWNKVRRRDILRVDIGETDDSSHPLFPLHLGINISEERIDQQRSARVLLLREAIKELHKKTSDSRTPARLSCDLCNVLCGCPLELKHHFSTVKHRVCEERLFSDDLQLDLSREELSKLELKT